MILPEHVRIGPSPIHGQGLFAQQVIPAGDEIEYAGNVVPASKANGNRYLFMLTSRLVVDGADLSLNPAGYINHACAPNCYASPKGKKLMIRTGREIAAGEELTLDYGPGYFDQFIRPHGCRCSACRNPKPEVSIGPEGLFVFSPSGLCLGVKFSHEQRQQLAEWFPGQNGSALTER